MQDLIFDLLTFLKDLGLFQKFPARNSTASFQQKKNPKQTNNWICILVKALCHMILNTRLTLKSDGTTANPHIHSAYYVLLTGKINSATLKDKFHLTH